MDKNKNEFDTIPVNDGDTVIYRCKNACKNVQNKQRSKIIPLSHVNSPVTPKNNNPELKHFRSLLTSDDRVKQLNAIDYFHDRVDHLAIKELVKIIENDEIDDEIRDSAMKSLVVTGDRLAVEPVIRVMENENNSEQTRLTAIDSLCKLGGGRAVEPLVKILGKNIYPSILLKGKVVEALGKLGDPRAVEPLVKILGKNSYPYILLKRKVAEALGKLGDPRAVEELIKMLGWLSYTVYEDGRVDDIDDYRPVAIRSLGQIGDPRAVEPLINAAFIKVRDGIDGKIHCLVIQALQSINDPRAVELLINVLEKRKSAFKRSFAAKALGKLGDSRAVEPLVKVLEKSKSKSDSLFSEVIEALGKIGGTRVTEVLIGALESGEARYCEHDLSMVIALGDARDPLAVELLVKMLDDPAVDEHTRQIAARGLEKIGDPRAVEPLIKVLEVLEKSTEFAGHSLLSSVISALRSFHDPRTVEPLIRALENGKNQLDAIFSLGCIGDPRAIEPLRTVLEDKNGEEFFREHAVKALGRINTPEAIKVLINALASDASHYVQYTLVTVLGKIDDPLIIEPLGKLLCNDGAYELPRREAALILGRKGGQLAVEPLIKALDKIRINDIRGEVIHSLGRLGDKRSVSDIYHS